MRSVPTFLKGAFRRALVLVMEALEGMAALAKTGAVLETLHAVAPLAPSPSLPRWSGQEGPNSGNVLRNLPQDSWTVCWRRVSEEPRRGPIWPDGNADENMMSS